MQRHNHPWKIAGTRVYPTMQKRLLPMSNLQLVSMALKQVSVPAHCLILFFLLQQLKSFQNIYPIKYLHSLPSSPDRNHAAVMNIFRMQVLEVGSKLTTQRFGFGLNTLVDERY